MRAFQNHGADSRFTALIDPVEAQLLTQLVGQISSLLESIDDGIPDVSRDTALLRLLPDAYPGDREASAEFRRFTAADLADRKTRNASVVAADLAEACASGSPFELSLGDASVQAWLRSLTDVRLILASRLGIETDDDVERDYDGDEEQLLAGVYDWLGWVQGSLVHALDMRDAEKGTG